MKKITANWGLKVISLAFAAMVWFLVTNISDPSGSVRFTNIPVTIKNANLITEQGQVYTVLDGSDTISSVTVRGPRSVIDSLSQNNIVATADIQNLSSLNTVSIEVATNKYFDKLEKITPSSDILKLSVERKVSKSFAISATTSGTLADGYIIGDVSTEQNMIRVSGPESVVNSISKAAVDVDVTGFTSNIGTDADIVLLDSDGEAIAITSSVVMNIKTVRVNVVIYETKYVPVNYIVTGEPASGYALTGEIESNPEQVLVAGRSSTISNVSELNVTDDNLNVTGLSSNLNTTVDLSKALPYGVILGDKEFNGTASVVVHIGAIIDKTIDVNIRNINIVNPIDGYKIKVDDSEYTTVSLTLHGLTKDLAAVSAADLEGTVDVKRIISDNNLSKLSPGTYSAVVTWALPEGVVEKTAASVYVTVEEDD